MSSIKGHKRGPKWFECLCRGVFGDGGDEGWRLESDVTRVINRGDKHGSGVPC